MSLENVLWESELQRDFTRVLSGVTPSTSWAVFLFAGVFDVFPFREETTGGGAINSYIIILTGAIITLNPALCSIWNSLARLFMSPRRSAFRNVFAYKTEPEAFECFFFFCWHLMMMMMMVTKTLMTMMAVYAHAYRSRFLIETLTRIWGVYERRKKKAAWRRTRPSWLTYLPQQGFWRSLITPRSPWVCLVFTGTCCRLDPCHFPAHIVYRCCRFQMASESLLPLLFFSPSSWECGLFKAPPIKY